MSTQGRQYQLFAILALSILVLSCGSPTISTVVPTTAPVVEQTLPAGSLELAMTLSTSSGEEVVSPTDKQIHQALSALDEGRDGLGWAILGQSELTYLQVSGDKTRGFAMEYQEEDVKRHYRAAREHFSLEEVERAFSEYRDGMIEWSVYGRWNQISM